MPKPGSLASNFQNILRQAQKMQKRIAALQEKLEEEEYVGEAAGGIVRATVTGRHEIVRIDVDTEEVDTSDVELLLDLVAAAANDGIRRAREDAEAKTNEITGGMKIPGLT